MTGPDDRFRNPGDLGDRVVRHAPLVSAGLGIMGLVGCLVAWLVGTEVVGIVGLFSIVLGAALWGLGDGIEARRLGATRRSASWAGIKSIGGYLFWWMP